MAESHPLANFPGISQVVSCQLTVSHGITPSVAMLEIAPQKNFTAEGGTLTLFDEGTGVKIEFPDCKVDKHSFHRTPSGDIWRLSIYDRRWKWAFGEISGWYNQRAFQGAVVGPGGKPPEEQALVEDTKKTPQELAKLCLDAMGEVNYDAGAIPNLTYPETEWDYENPAKALADLCDSLGCRVVLGLDNRVRIVKLGVGAQLPTTPDIMDAALSINPPERPDALKVVCGKTRVLFRFPLEAVGLDLDGAIKPIEKLSYRPAIDGNEPSRWASIDLPFFKGVGLDGPGALLNADDIVRAQALARLSVFRWYRVMAPLTVEGLVVPTGIDPKGKKPQGAKRQVTIAIDDIKQVLPLEDVQVATVLELGEAKPKPAQIFGVFAKDGLGGKMTNSAFADECKLEFKINKDAGIVEFKRYVYQKTDTDKHDQAELYLHVAASVRIDIDANWLRYEIPYSFPGPKFNTPARILRHDEVVLNVDATYDTTTLRVVRAKQQILKLATNEADVKKEAGYYLGAALREYQTTFPQEATYVGLKRIEPDGAIQQVGWAIGPQGTTTRVGRNNEFDTRVPSYKERRLFEKIRGDQIDQLKKQAKKKTA